MPIELGLWRIDKELTRLEIKSLDLEDRLEDLLDKDINIASPNWMIIGRQVLTDYGQYIDLLAIDRDGNLIVLELKRDKTPREVVAQLLDYGSWIKDRKDDDIADTFKRYIEKYHKERGSISLDEAFCKRFGAKEMPEELNESHELVIIASRLDESTERIVSYLADYNVAINAVFFRVCKDGDQEYLSRVWFIDPTNVIPAVSGKDKEPWNGEFYVSFGDDGNGRAWEDAMKYSFISGGGAPWYTRTLYQLEVGNRVWVNVPRYGYTGVGIVERTPIIADEFKTRLADGTEKLLSECQLKSRGIFGSQDEEKAEYVVAVKWLKTMPLKDAVKEKGFFGNQNTVCKPTTKKWQHTVERLKSRFGVE